jgi:hypothetical protein
MKTRGKKNKDFLTGEINRVMKFEIVKEKPCEVLALEGKCNLEEANKVAEQWKKVDCDTMFKDENIEKGCEMAQGKTERALEAIKAR